MKSLRRTLLISLLLLSFQSKASMLNDYPVVWMLTGNNPTYQQAACKVQQAFLIQSGIGPTVDKFTDDSSKRLQGKVASFIDEDTPLSSKAMFTVLSAAYTVGVKKNVVANFANPIVPSIQNTLDLTQNSGTLTFRVTF